MTNDVVEINNKIKLHYFNEDKYKTNFISVFLTVSLNRDTVTINALIPAILRRGTSKLNTMKDIEIEMENMYGSQIDCGIDKSGDNHTLKFYIESIKDEYVKDNIFEESISNISDLILNPYLINGTFSSEYVQQEKNTLKTVINDKINDKMDYAVQRCVEEMYNNDNFGLYVYGYTKDLENITSEDLYNQYINILKTAKIDIFVFTNNEKQSVIDNINKYFKSDILNERNNIYEPKVCCLNNSLEKREIIDSLDVVQGKLVIGVDILDKNLDLYDITICNAILGVGCNSKIFRNVREREHLVYSAGSNFVPSANILLIKAGIEINNYNKAIDVINEQIDDIKCGNITEKEFEDAKQIIISLYKTLVDDQTKTINYYINQEMLLKNISIEDAIKNIENVKLKDVIKVANNLKINTIYFLKNI